MEKKVRKTRSDYVAKFKAKHGDFLNDTMQCSVCSGKFKYVNKVHHVKTAKHRRAMEMGQNREAPAEGMLVIHPHNCRVRNIWLIRRPEFTNYLMMN